MLRTDKEIEDDFMAAHPQTTFELAVLSNQRLLLEVLLNIRNEFD